MASFRFLAAALLSAAAFAAENPAAGRWNCTNISTTGVESPWTLLLREDGTKLAGSFTDGEAEIPLSEIKSSDGLVTFRFYVNGKPYAFEGKIDGKRLEGKYSGEEASGKLGCTKPSSRSQLPDFAPKFPRITCGIPPPPA
jgi:hypothetical protein